MKEKGLLAMPDSKRGKKLSGETVVLVKQFYCDIEFSGLIPGKKDFVSIGKNKHEQKHLILCNLKELYAEFKGCVLYIFASLFLSLNESTCQTSENAFYFTSKVKYLLHVLKKIKF